MSLPWDSSPAPRPQPQQPYTPPPAPRPPASRPQPAPQQRMPAERMQPDIKPQNKSLDELIQEAINEALIANRANIEAKGKQLINKAAQGTQPKKLIVDHSASKTLKEVKDEHGNSMFVHVAEDIEEAWEGGPVTTRTFIQGMAVDIGFAMMAALATVLTPNFNAFDKEAWTVVGVLMLKTVIQTGMSYMMKLNVN